MTRRIRKPSERIINKALDWLQLYNTWPEEEYVGINTYWTLRVYIDNETHKNRAELLRVFQGMSGWDTDYEHPFQIFEGDRVYKHESMLQQVLDADDREALVERARNTSDNVYETQFEKIQNMIDFGF